MNRRDFIVLGGACAAAAGISHGLSRREKPLLEERVVAEIPGHIVGADVVHGHLLRDGNVPAPTREIKTEVLIAGGGIAGLSAAWALDRAGWNDFLVLELEREAGGTSTWGSYPASKCPWGAHYLPLPSPRARAAVALLEELKVIVGTRPDGAFAFEERYLCHEPQERLHMYGTWQEGIYPHLGATREEMAERAAFNADMERWRKKIGRDGKPAFTIPIAECSRDPEILALDKMSMADYMAQKKWTGKRIQWYVGYACRDDYGCRPEDTSAWVGIHYFASRGQGRGHGYESDEVLTWPEGNGWIARQLRERVAGRLMPRMLVLRMAETRDGVEADALDVERGEVTRVRARHAIAAMPRFIAARVVAGYAPRVKAWSYAPWVVSNVAVDRPPPERRRAGFPLAWDNVRYDSETLGYVVATHQSLRTVPGPTVLTHYLPLLGPPREARAAALDRPWTHWRDAVLADLAVPHPGIEQTVQRLDTMVWGHAMVRPVPGFVWSEERRAGARPQGRIRFAHCDLSGIAIFEEAQYHGVAAAESVMRAARHGFAPLT